MTLEQEKANLENFANLSILSPAIARNKKIIAEGDSWFDYPLQKDIIDYLRQMGYALYRRNNLARYGDTLENMVYGTEFKINSNERYVENHGPKSLDATLSSIATYKPRFVLFSAGGNDIVGEEMIRFLNHVRSGHELFKRDEYLNHVNVSMKKAIQHFIFEVHRVDPGIDILMDGYDYPIPNGKRINIAGIIKKGPWLLSNMGAKGITARPQQVEIIKEIVDGFNEMLIDLDRSNDKFHHVNLRGMFRNDDDWHNEIHLKRDGYKKVAEEYHKKICLVLGQNPLV